jgi:long-chain fatty acid transport protein
MSGMKRNVVLALAVAAAVAAPSAFATNGYFAHGYSVKEKGLAGAGVAMAQDSLVAATNPAGMVMVGSRMDVGASLFSPSPRSYDAVGTSGVPDGTVCGAACPFDVGPQKIESDNDLFLIPHFGRNWMLDSNSSFGVSVYGNGGMNTEFKGGTSSHNNGLGTQTTTAGTFGDGTAGVDLMQLFITSTYAKKITPTSSWGASVIFAYQRFKATGLSNFAGYSTDGTNLSNNGYDTSTGFGAKLGIQGEVSPGVTLGASYQSEVKMGEFDKYKGLFAEQGDFDIPATATAGIAFKVTPTSTVTLDVQKIWYSKIKAVGNPLSKLTDGSCTSGAPATGSGCLGGSNGAGFGWQDMTIYKLGYQWQSNKDWTWRVGYSQGDQPVPESEVLFNILAPAVIEQHVTFGFTNQMDKSKEFNFSFMYALEDSVKGANAFAAPGTQTIELKMKQYEVGASLGWKF